MYRKGRLFPQGHFHWDRLAIIIFWISFIPCVISGVYFTGWAMNHYLNILADFVQNGIGFQIITFILGVVTLFVTIAILLIISAIFYYLYKVIVHLIGWLTE